MKKYFLSFLLITLAAFSFGQGGYYRAIVYNYNDGEPIVGAEVWADTVSTPAKTDTNGFVVIFLSSGQHEIRISSTGKSTQLRKVIIQKDKILTERVFLFETSDDIVIAEPENSPRFSDKQFLKYTDSVMISGSSLKTGECFVKEVKDLRRSYYQMNVVMYFNDVLKVKDFEITNAWVVFGGMIYTTPDIEKRAGFFRFKKQKEEPVVFAAFTAPPCTGRDIAVILEISQNGKKEYLGFKNGVFFYPSDE
ncbi:MAG: hypothetical protein ACOZCO_09285 [Bacteroidota bacterium]